MRTKLTKKEWLARCANAFDMGFITPERMALLERWTDAALRAGAVACGARQQADYLVEFLEQERNRLRLRTSNDDRPLLLASDVEGYALCHLAAIFNHHCQRCAEDPQAWHTRGAFCPHRDQPTGSQPTAPPKRKKSADDDDLPF